MQEEERIRYLEQELKAVRHEITELKAAIGTSSIAEVSDINDWTSPKKSKARAASSLLVMPLNSS
jgi:hypothetical protein